MDKSLVNIADYGFNILQIETLSSCNMNCSFCPYILRSDKDQILPEEVVLKTVNSLEVDMKLKYICFSQYNEPLLDKRIYSFIRAAKKRGFKVMIITNGTLFNSQSTITNLIESKPDFIKISLQTLDSKMFNKIRGTNISFQEYKKGIFEFLSASLSNGCKIVLDIACNFLTGYRNVKTGVLGLERGDPSIYSVVNDFRSDLTVFLKELNDFDKRFIFKKSDITQYLDNCLFEYDLQRQLLIGDNVAIKTKAFVYGKRLTEFYPAREGATCPSNLLGILASGLVVPCCLIYDGKMVMGNIRDESLKSILENNSSFLTSLREGRNLPIFCRRCQGSPSRRGLFVKQIKNKLSRVKT